jgi:hypothetical protein
VLHAAVCFTDTPIDRYRCRVNRVGTAEEQAISGNDVRGLLVGGTLSNRGLRLEQKKLDKLHGRDG